MKYFKLLLSGKHGNNVVKNGDAYLLLKGNFVNERNYYEDFVRFYSWWPIY